jgi:ATP-binding cassette subfamily B protein
VIAPGRPADDTAGVVGSTGGITAQARTDAARYEPVAVTPRRQAPPVGVDPDTSLGWVRRMLPMVRVRTWLLVVSMVAAVVALGAQVAVPAVLARAIDEALVDRTRTIGVFVVVLVALAAIRGVTAATYRYGLYRLAFQVETDLRSVLYRKLTRLSFTFFDTVQSGQVISRANADIRSVQMFLAVAPLITLSLLSFVLALAVMLSIDIPLTILAVAPMPLVYVLGVALRNRVFPLTWISQARLAELATVVDENVNGVRVVKSFAAEKRQLDELARTARRVRWAQTVTIDTRAKYAPLMENLPRLGQVAVLGFGGWQVINGSLQIGDLVAFNIYIAMIQVPFRLLGFVLLLAQRARASAGRIFEILDAEPDIVDAPDAVDLGEVAGAVAFNDVTFGYTTTDGADGPDVLAGFTLTLAPGETVALVGATGSGKSTAARLLPRFYDVRSGSVTVDGHDVRDVQLTSLRHNVGVVLDEPFLFSSSVADNIAYGRPDASRDDIVAAATAAQADGFITALPDGYDTVVGERGFTLSGGQRQRIAIARTLLANPPVLVLDDATSAIDVTVESAIHAALEQLLAGRTTLVIAHRVSTIALADRVALLDGGAVVATGTHTELLEREPRYAQVLAAVARHEVERDTIDDGGDGDDAGRGAPAAPPPVGVAGGIGGSAGGIAGGLPGGLGGMGGGML